MTGLLRYIAASCACEALRVASLMPHPLAYRGVVSCGKFAIEGNFIVGPAVDEAAGLMEISDAAVVWLAPRASSLPQQAFIQKEPPWEDLFVRMRVPLKSGRELHAPVLSPFAFCNDVEAKHVRKKMLGTMAGTNVEVVIKRQNTSRILGAILRRRELLAKKRTPENARVVDIKPLSKTSTESGKSESPPTAPADLTDAAPPARNEG